MKKLTSIFLLLSVLLSLYACTPDRDGEGSSSEDGGVEVVEYGGSRIMIVSDNHYAIDRATRVGPRTGKTYKTSRINSYGTQHNNYGYSSETHIQALIDTIKAEHARKPIDAVMVLGDMTDMDFWYKFFVEHGIPSDLGDTNGDGDVDIEDLYKSDYDELYYVKTEYFDQLLDFTYEDASGETQNGSVPCFFTLGNHDFYHNEWFYDLFVENAMPSQKVPYVVTDEVSGKTYSFDGISVRWEGDADYAVYFDKNGAEDLAFFMMNTFTGTEVYTEIFKAYLAGEGEKPAQTMSGVWAYEELAAISEDAFRSLLHASRDYKQIYIGAHYVTGNLWKDRLSASSTVKAIYVGDAHTETDNVYAGVPYYIDGCFVHSFNTLYDFKYNFAAEPWSYMMLETKTDKAQSYRVHAEMEYCISEGLFFRHKKGDSEVRSHADSAHGTDGYYAEMTIEEFATAVFEETLATLGTSAPGILEEHDGKLYYKVDYARYILKGKNKNAGIDYDGKYVFPVER